MPTADEVTSYTTGYNNAYRGSISGMAITAVMGNPNLRAQAMDMLSKGITMPEAALKLYSPSEQQIQKATSDAYASIAYNAGKNNQKEMAEASLKYLRSKVAILAGSEFDYAEYYRRNPQVAEEFLKYIDSENTFKDQKPEDFLPTIATAQEFYALQHYINTGAAQGLLFADQAPQSTTPEPTTGATTTGGGGGGGFSIPSFTMPAIPDTSATYQALLNQVNAQLSALQSTTTAPPTKQSDVVVPDIERAPILSDAPFELLSINRSARNLNPYIGFESRKKQTYLQSIGFGT